MSSNRIKSLALATAIATCAGVGLPSMADAHYRGARHYGWHSGWHKHWHAHRGWARYGCARPGNVRLWRLWRDHGRRSLWLPASL